MSAIDKSVDLLEEKLNELLERYIFLKEENEILLNNISDLQRKNAQYDYDLSQEREKNRLLKIAKTIDGSIENSKETKQKINALIREIDKCIVVLNQ